MPGKFYVNSHLEKLMFDELQHHVKAGGVGGFLPAVKQIANVACLPGIVNVRPRNQILACALDLQKSLQNSIGLPDVHSGYGFAIGNVAAFDMMNPESVVSPGRARCPASLVRALYAATNSRRLMEAQEC